MELNELISDELWITISNNFLTGNYTGAIQDTIFYLSNIIREKSDSENDGVSLINEVFSQTNPKIKVNKLESISEKDIQIGIGNILRGLYQSIRNPRMHEKIIDTKEDAFKIILFVDYIISKLEKSKGKFDENEMYKLVFEDEFVKEKEYFDKLTEQIPKKKRFEIFINILENYPEKNIENLRYFSENYFRILSEDETIGVLNHISNELRKTDSDNIRKKYINMIPSGKWAAIENIAKIRTENRVLNSIREGKKPKNGNKNDGWLATWCGKMISEIAPINKVYIIICEKIRSFDEEEQRYIFRHILPMFWENITAEVTNGNKEQIVFKTMVELIDGLRINFIDNITSYNFYLPKEIRELLIEVIEMKKDDIEVKRRNKDDDGFVENLPF